MTSNVEVNENKPRIQYIADGVNKTFEFPFKIFNPEDLVVYFDDTVQSTDLYSVTIDTEEANGSITFSTTPQAGVQITLSRELSIKRISYFQEQSAIRPEPLDKEFDYQIACTQQLADAINRTMILPVYTDDSQVSMVLPAPSAGKAILWSADGKKLENSTIEINNLTAQMQEQVAQAATSAQTATEKADAAIEAVSNIAIPIPDTADAGKFLTTDGSVSSWANISSAAEFSTKANTDLSNVSANIDYVVESYDDGNGNWYRIYKSGWLEQGGVFTPTNSTTGNKTETISFLKNFANNNALVFVSEYGTLDGNVRYPSEIRSINTSDFTYYLNRLNITKILWYACGQGATE